MKRAIVLFVEDKLFLLKQFFCFYTSFKEIQCTDTDIVVFGTKSALDKLPNDIIKRIYDPISYEANWNNYHYINSISCLTSPDAAFLKDYDYLLRTDLDTFLTPAWNHYFPSLYSVGRGGYVNDQQTKNRLYDISNHFHLTNKKWHNLGSTHYGNAALVLEVAKLSTQLSTYIFHEVFKETEGTWPGWYRGVTTMYACELAINHLVDDLTIDEIRLDYPSSHISPISLHPHIHCWHTENLFSKYMFEADKYSLDDLKDLNLQNVPSYCLHIALKSKSLFHQNLY